MTELNSLVSPDTKDTCLPGYQPRPIPPSTTRVFTKSVHSRSVGEARGPSEAEAQ